MVRTIPLCQDCQAKCADCAHGNLRDGQSCYDTLDRYDEALKRHNQITLGGIKKDSMYMVYGSSYIGKTLFKDIK